MTSRDLLLLSAVACAVCVAVVLGWTVVIAARLLRMETGDSNSSGRASVERMDRTLRWQRIAGLLSAFGVVLLVRIAFQSEILENDRRWIAQILFVGAPLAIWVWITSLTMFCALCLEALEPGSSSTPASIRRRFVGAWLLLLALPGVAACLIVVSLQSGHGLAAFLVLPAVGIWFPALEARVIRRFMKVREWSTLDPIIDVSDLAASTRLAGTPVMLWESDEPDTESSACNAISMGLGSARSIFVFDGLLRILNHGQVRAIVAHEYAHHACRHHRKSLIAMSAFTAACTWVAVLASSEAREDVALIGMLVLACGGPLLLRALSRAHEYEADRRAAELVPAEDLASALEMLDREEPEGPQGIFRGWLSTHPPIQRRISRLRSPG